ncbi:TetR/AcrR family transcriptional regulator [Paenibacillus frigoriresistens]|uniref:TetR/AcrR family transcriptional regulator n=1 Tax=Paenibacillus alginolyticus TaxID=59839 RepID=UPI001565509E|nr:TetR/AcrR family transcriptional regulator [Paenibacillus frigoriresistens]NRF93207.1 TetR/AcrR family transcriptional regulator [Paenibacillus frigoriresistens]
MIITKQEIIRSATKLFKERGFLLTSIQDIADDCLIAKGSVYKYFQSKEELFSEVFDHCQNTYFEQAERIKFLPGISSRELFFQQIVFRFQYFLEYKFILVEFTELPIQQDAKFYPLRLRVRGRLMKWHKDCLLDMYGKEIELHLWDLAFIYKALLKEYLFWIIHEVKMLSIEGTAHFILEKMDVLVKHLIASGSKPMLQQSSFEQYIHWGLEGREEGKAQVIAELLRKLTMTLNEIQAGNEHRRELHEILNLLRNEISKKVPNGPLTHALLAYLEKENQLKSLVLQLKNIIASGT